MRFAPLTTISYVGLHAGCLAVLWTGASTSDIAVCVASYGMRAIGLTIGYHRYFAHRSFKTSRLLQFLLGLLGALSLQKGPLWWAQTHRDHHRHADTPEDIHSPHHQGFLYSHSGWFLNARHARTDLSKVEDLARYPELRWLDDSRVLLILILLFVLLLYLLGGWSGVIWGFFISTVWLMHTTHWIQSMSHKYGGYRRCPTNDDSRNHWLLGVISLGEFHNNHHYCPSSARQGFVWWELDVGYWILRALRCLGVVWDLRQPDRYLGLRSAPRQRGAQRKPDAVTVHHRVD